MPQSPDRGSQQQLLELAETKKSLQDIQEQFSSYRKERKENDSILRKQVDEFRDQASTLRLDNTKLVSKVSKVVSLETGVYLFCACVELALHLAGVRE